MLVLTFVFAVPLALLAQRANAFGVETRASDLWFHSRPQRAPRTDMIIVARDEKTLKEMGPPTHADYGRLIRKLKAAGAKWIVMDIDLGDRQGHAADRALWTAIADSHRTLVMVRYAQTRTGEPDADELRGLRALEKSAHWQEIELRDRTPEWGWLNFAPATSDFIHSAHGAGVAVTEQSLDPDGIVRRSRAGYLAKVLYPADAKQGKLTNYYAVVPSLPVITAVSAMGGDKYALDYDFGERLTFGKATSQPLDSKGFIPMDYIGREGSYPRVSMAEVLKKEPLPDYFRNRIVFVGSTIPTDDLTEYRLTPFGSRMPRVEMTANQVQAFLDQRPLVEPHRTAIAGILGLALVLGLLVGAFRGGWSMLGALLALLLYLAVGWVLFWQRSIMLPLLPALSLTLLSMLGALGLAAWLKPWAVARVVETRDTGMAAGPGEELPELPTRRGFGFRRNRGL